MEVLNNELAQSIIERTTNVVVHNINIMNEQGIIIASGDKKRIGNKHEGAVIALSRKNEFHVDKDQIEKLSGVCQGVNLPIEFQKKIVGVIGVTGKPSEVLGYGKLIKLTAEMMIEQEYAMKELEWSNRIKKEILMSIVHGKQDSCVTVEKYVEKFNIPLKGSMAMLIFEVDYRDVLKIENSGILASVLIMLEGTLGDSLAAVMNSRTISMLYKGDFNYSQMRFIEVKLTEAFEEVKRQFGIGIKASIGKSYDKLSDMGKSFEIAKETLMFGKSKRPENNIYFFNSLKENMLFCSVSNEDKWKKDELKATYELIDINDKNGELKETLKVLVEENGELNHVSERLFIHRNTLKYRLDKIHKLTAKNPKNYVDLFWLYSSILSFCANE
ncbi:MAG: sugar diacid recognition domain-containing protein [Clostridiaceae bacterium]